MSVLDRNKKIKFENSVIYSLKILDKEFSLKSIFYVIGFIFMGVGDSR